MASCRGERLTGKHAVVTGGASGFGAGIVRRFVAEGAMVGIVDLDLSKADALALELGDGTYAVQADVSEATSVRRLADLVFAKSNRIDILINNAGMGQKPAPLEAQGSREFDQLFATNARSVFLTARMFVPVMKRQRAGVILNMASCGAVRPRPNLAWYNASKGWVIAATRAMAVELASFGIRVIALNPVAGDTPMLSTFLAEDTTEARQRMVDSIPLGRLSSPRDMGAAAAFLCSDEASMVTGVALEVDGGRCL